MTPFGFRVIRQPFPTWLGPYTPARGSQVGFRIHRGRVGTWVETNDGMAFWSLVDSEGARLLNKVVAEHWTGGRVLLLPNGLVIKPLQSESDAGVRVAVGQFSGPVVLQRPNAAPFDMSQSGALQPGDPWPGPATTGLECVIQPDGSLRCEWYEPTEYGRDATTEVLVKPDAALARGFTKARPGTTSGRVRLTCNGIVLTNRQQSDGSWSSRYVGQIAPGTFRHRREWIRKEPT